MKKAALIYNPASGRQHGRRMAQIEAAARVLHNTGVETIIAASKGPGEAGAQAQQMIADGCDSILACGGDGTIHDVIQGMVYSQAAVGIIPLGTANALAHDLGVPRNPVAAARLALTAERRRVAVGRVTFNKTDSESQTRYFIVAAGVGVDAHLFYRIHSRLKQRMGMKAYYAEAFHLWFTHELSRFEVELTDPYGNTRRESVSQMLAVRITQFGGVLRKLAPGAALDRNDVQVLLFRTSSRVPYLLYLIKTLLRGDMPVPGVELVHTSRLTCRPLTSGNGATARIYAEADGELLGKLPVEITVVPRALTLLVPQSLAMERLQDKLLVSAAPPVGDAIS